MKGTPDKPSETALSWQRELFGYLEDITRRRRDQLRAEGEAASADPVPADPVPADGAPTVGVPPTRASSEGAAPRTVLEQGAEAAAAGSPADPGPLVSAYAGDRGSAWAPVSSGVSELDARLGGGFFPGLWTIVGPPAAGTTAFLESVAWEAVAHHRAVVYYALAQGAEAVRERFFDTLSFIVGGLIESDDAVERGAVRAADVRGRWWSVSDVPAYLEQTVWYVMLSRIWIADSLPEGPEPVGVFLRGLEGVLEDVAGRVGHPPMVLIDDLGTLLRGLGVESAIGAARLVTGLNGALGRCASAGLMAAAPDVTALLTFSGQASAEGLLQLGHGRLELAARSPVRRDVTIRENPHADWRGTLPLMLHPAVGMFTMTADVGP